MTASFADILVPLAKIAQEQSLIAASLAIDEHATVSDLLIEPRFWPVPKREAIDSAVPSAQRPKPVSAIDAVNNARVVIVSGEASAGVTSALLWILEEHFRRYGTLAPAYAQADERLSMGRLEQAVGAARAQVVQGDHEQAPPVLLAIDDAVLTDRRAQARLKRFLEDEPNVTVLIGCHDDTHDLVAGMLEGAGTQHQRVFLAPFGRREMRQLVTRIAGPNSGELVGRVLSVIHGQGLARNALNVAALVAVVTQEEDLTELNESGLLQSYVNILLENPIAVDPEGLAMDYRRREHFLSQFAAHLVELNRSRVSRAEGEQFVLNYFDRLGWHSASAGRLIDSLIQRRVLSETEVGVGFRYQALLHLFAAKWAIEDPAFLGHVLEDPVRFDGVVKHAAGLRRSDAALLTTVGQVVATMVAEAAPGVAVGQFEFMTDRDGWAQIKDLEQVRQLVTPAPPEPTEDELDEMYDEVAVEPSIAERAEAFPIVEMEGALDRLGPPVELLASVLKSSELVADVDLKARLLRQLIEAWSMLTILLAVREDETQELRKVLEPLFGSIANPAKRESLIEHFSRVLVATVMTFVLYGSVGSRHLELVLARVMEDDEFMGETALALFATMLYAMLEFPDWPDRLAELQRRHPRHPMVGEVARRWALRRYTSGSLDAGLEARLENVLVDMFMPTGAVKAGPNYVATTNEVRERLRRSKTREQWLEGTAGEPDELAT